MKNAKIKNRQKLGMLVVTMVLVLLMTLIAGMLTGCGKNTARSTDGTESNSAGGNGSAGSGKGRFIESKVALPEEINSILQFKALSDGTLEIVGQDADYGIYVAKSSDGGGSWETTPLEDISYSNVAVAEDGTVAFLDYTENGLCQVTIVDADGSTHTFSIEMPAEDAFVSVAAFDSNKQLIIRDTEGGLYGIDCTDGSKTVTFEIDEDTYIPYFDVVGTNCYIVTSDKVLCYDTATGKETDELTALTEQICSDDNLVYRNSDTGLPVTFAKAEKDNSIIFADYKADSAKVDMCLNMISNAVESGHKILLFSQFTTMLDHLAKRLEEEKISYYMLTGSTSKEKRAQMVENFNTDDTQVFCISLKAGGTGLNLTAADIVIHFDPWWNLAVQNQATDRAHRIGQKNVVNVYKLIVKDTIEENILKLQEKKRELADQILEGEGLNGGSFTKEELMELLSGK